MLYVRVIPLCYIIFWKKILSQYEKKKGFVTENSCNHIKAFLSTLLALLKIKATT